MVVLRESGIRACWMRLAILVYIVWLGGKARYPLAAGEAQYHRRIRGRWLHSRSSPFFLLLWFSPPKQLSPSLDFHCSRALSHDCHSV